MKEPELDEETAADFSRLQQVAEEFLSLKEQGAFSQEDILYLERLIELAPWDAKADEQDRVDAYVQMLREEIYERVKAEEISVPQQPTNGWKVYASGSFYYVNGVRTKGWAEIDGKTYFFDEQGFMKTGWVEFDEGWRYFAADGKMATGWLQIGNAWYYLDPETGLMYNDGLHTIGKSTYYFYDWGGMASDWWYEDEAGDWYFFGGSGAMKAAQWLDWKGDWYYLTETGRMAVDTEIGGYHVNANGVWAK